MLRSFTGASIRWLIAAWFCLCVAGMAWLWRWENRPGRAADAPASWPASFLSLRSPGTETIVVALHPKCTCTRSTIAELSRLLLRHGGQIHALVLVFAPDSAARDWDFRPTVMAARALPYTRVLLDTDGLAERAFGAHTSGQALLFDATGRLRFAGGLTPSRAVEGDSSWPSALDHVVFAAGDSASRSPVFGCSIDDPAAPR